MSDIQHVSLEELQNQYTDEAAYKKATKKPTLPKGNYHVRISRQEVIKAPEGWRNPGRHLVNLTLAVYEEGYQNQILFDTVSFEPYMVVEGAETGKWISVGKGDDRYGEGVKVDGQFKKWTQILKVLGLTPTTNIADVIDGLVDSDMRVFVSESFKTDEGEYLRPESDEEREDLLKAGYESYNNVLTYSKAKM